ncbi:unnamed protein product [Moneuplotes crassus]|uniref:Uncharacterized protein n=1 Tax=Euplotes crassus TaxID=5936 RepID=A0AAD1X9P7_EUPCR|nr:unnamed protein product [Moneuplotes crassus]
MKKDSDGLVQLSKKKAAQLSRIIESSIVHGMKKNPTNLRSKGTKKEEFTREKLKEIEKKSKARRYQFKVSELDSNINLKNYLIDKIENMGLQSAKSQISGKIDTFLNDAFRVQNLKNQTKNSQQSDYLEKLKRLNKIGVVDHPYKIPYKKIYERDEKKNLLGSYYSDRANGRKVEFLNTRIPTPKMKYHLNAKVVKELFMDEQIKNYACFTNFNVRIDGRAKEKGRIKYKENPQEFKEEIFNKKMSVSGLTKAFSKLSSLKDNYLSDADVYNFIKNNKDVINEEDCINTPSFASPRVRLKDEKTRFNSTQNFMLKKKINTPNSKHTIFTSLDNRPRCSLNTSKIEKRAKSTLKEGKINVSIKDKSLNIQIEESKISPAKTPSKLHQISVSNSNIDTSKNSFQRFQSNLQRNNRICEKIKRSKKEFYSTKYPKLKSVSPSVTKSPISQLLKTKDCEQESSKLRSKVLSFICKLDTEVKRAKSKRKIFTKIRPKKGVFISKYAYFKEKAAPLPNEVLNLDL